MYIWMIIDKEKIMDIVCYSCGRGEKPENTIEGIRHCQKINPDWRIEMDIQLTKDGHLVLFHDFNTKKITGQNKQINELELSSVKELNPGYNFKVRDNFPYRDNPIKIPTLSEVCTQFPKAKLLLDIHTNDLTSTDKVIEIIELKSIQDQVIIVSEYDEVLDDIKKKRPNWKYGAAEKEAKKTVYSSFLFLDNLFPIQSDILMIPVKYWNFKVLNSRIISHIKKRNKEIWVWRKEGKKVETIDTIEEYCKYKQKGIDGIFTEFPSKLNSELKKTQ